ncbi:MAG: hypothetical protein OHK0031_00010 [Anaerolineales bacterium]
MFRNFFTPQGTLNLRARLTLAFVTLSLFVAALAASVVYGVVQNQILQQLRQRALSMATLAALEQDANLHITLTRPSDEGNSIFRSLRAKNEALIATDPDIGSIYTMRQNTNGDIYFVVDSVNEKLSVLRGPAKLGEIYSDPGPLLTENFATLDHPIVESEPYTDAWGTWLSAYAPFFRPDGTREGVLGLDISAQALTTARADTLRSTLWAILLLLPVFALMGWFIGGRLADPISRLTEGALRITSGDFSYRTEASTNDEVGQLSEAFNEMARKVDDLVSGLEQRVQERTAELEQQTSALDELSQEQQRRAAELQTVAQVGRAITSVQSLQELLPRIARVVSAQFGFYHVGIFLLSDDGKYAVLSAANSEGGQRLLEKSHRMRVGESGMVGYVTSSGNPRIALDTDQDQVFAKNPELPETRSEMTLPLKIGAQIIGALDVQSEKVNAFNARDVEILSILADQVSVALQNARLFEATQKSLAEAETTYRRYVSREWQRVTADGEHLGYRYSLKGAQRLDQALNTAEARDALLSGEAQLIQEKTTRLAIPLKLRGEVIGVIHVQTNTQRPLLEDEVDITRAIAERVSLAIENARLVQESQSRAALESTIGAISSRLTASVNMRNILQNAVEELGRTLPGSEVTLQLRNDANRSES